MNFTNFSSWLGGRGHARQTPRRDHRGRLACERLEDRVQPASPGAMPEVAVTAAVHYWADNQQIDLDVRAHELVVGLTPGVGSLQPLIAANGPLAGMTVRQWLTSDLAILRDPAPTTGDPASVLDARIAAASGVAGVSFASPVYQNPETGGWLVATNELIVAMAPGVEAPAALADPRFAGWEPLS